MRSRGEMAALNLTGAVVTLLIYSLTIAVFVARLTAHPTLELRLGVVLVLLTVPLLYLLLKAPASGRSGLYFVQLSLMLAYLLAELLLDYVFRLDFRSVRWMTVVYVTLFFAATGGMLGVASAAGKAWSYGAIGLFLLMALLAFVQRRLTGM